MDIDFIEEKYRDDVFKLMELTGMDMKEAFQLFQIADHNFQNALQMHFSKGEIGSAGFQPNAFQQKSKVSNKMTYVQEDFDDLYERFVMNKQNGLTFSDKYEIRREGGIMQSLSSIFKKSQQSQFKKQLEQYTGRTTTLKFCPRSLSETIEESCLKEKFPLIVHILDFDPKLKSELTSLYRDEMLINMLNVQFRNYGINPQKYEIENDFRQFVDPSIKNQWVILRVDVVDEVQVIETIDLRGKNAKEIMQKLKIVKNFCINKEMDEVHVERRLREQMMGNYNYKKPVTAAEKRKIEEDRAIRQKQEQQFFASMKKDEEIKKQNRSVPATTTVTSQINKKVEEKPPQKKKETIDKAKVLKRREQIRKKLKNYDQGMMIKLRMPSGDSVKIVVSQQQKVRYLYDYVESREEEVGFENDMDRKFDILRPYDQLNLTESLDKTLKIALQGSDMESLIVKQK